MTTNLRGFSEFSDRTVMKCTLLCPAVVLSHHSLSPFTLLDIHVVVTIIFFSGLLAVFLGGTFQRHLSEKLAAHTATTLGGCKRKCRGSRRGC